MDKEKLILDVIQLGGKKIRIIGHPNDFISIYSYSILNLENYDYIHITYHSGFQQGKNYQILIYKGGKTILELTEAAFLQFQNFIDLNTLLDLEPGTIEGLLLEVKMEYS